MTPEDHAITVQRIFTPDDGYVYKATVPEFPHLIEYADTYLEAYELMIDSLHVLTGNSNEENNQTRNRS